MYFLKVMKSLSLVFNSGLETGNQWVGYHPACNRVCKLDGIAAILSLK